MTDPDRTNPDRTNPSERLQPDPMLKSRTPWPAVAVIAIAAVFIAGIVLFELAGWPGETTGGPTPPVERGATIAPAK